MVLQTFFYQLDHQASVGSSVLTSTTLCGQLGSVLNPLLPSSTPTPPACFWTWCVETIIFSLSSVLNPSFSAEL
ncbi:hypothetical protein SADUNF_Sadunf19G0108700 [Salix dunnii]|uniref:Uncharacterized protein n=1 Tax=Salix dunnii TaxID=1413687 RepID=A0A835MI68_9ROSI|nr:hypothetical protein SADUNF_Sadunf19G0108700 [Salix dunnii]